MTHRSGVARGRDTIARWRNLAEQRLEYLTELFETGRWRRFHSELAFLENIQEAKSAVEAWRDLATREASRDNSDIDISSLGRSRPTLPRGERLRDRGGRPQTVESVDQPAAPEALLAAGTEQVSSDDAPSAPAMENVPELTTHIDEIEQRYPLLRNTL
jgi:uncharacterized repeat protein (TIGR03809 family)